MNPMNFLELIASISLQAFVIVLAAHLLSRATADERTLCRLWQMCFWVLLAVVIAAVALPHVRWTQARPDFDRRAVTSIALWELKIGTTALYVWCVGAIFAFIINVFRWIRTRMLIATCEEIDASLQRRIVELLRPEFRNGNFGKTRVLISSSLASPFCTQFHRPYIVLPSYSLDFEPQELAQIVRHELEHIQTGHPLQLFIQRVVEVLFWFHPMVWWASHQCDLCREFVCDGAAVESESPDEIVCYLKALLRVVEHTTVSARLHPLSFGRGKSSIARRAERLVERARGLRSSRRNGWIEQRTIFSFFAASVLFAGLLWIPLNIVGSPRSRWSPWPPSTAQVLQDLGLPVRDYELFDHDSQLHEVLNSDDDG
ncbi:MAG: M56 family metallopeptidase [Planctomycetaceae bacterium]